MQHVLLLNCRYTWSHAQEKCCVGVTLQLIIVLGDSCVQWKAVHDYWPPDFASCNVSIYRGTSQRSALKINW